MYCLFASKAIRRSPSARSHESPGRYLPPVGKGFPREGEKNANPGPPILFWVDQKQSSYKTGKRKLKVYCSKMTWVSFWYHCQRPCKTLEDMTFLALCGHTRKGQGLGGVRKEVVTLKPFAAIISRK